MWCLATLLSFPIVPSAISATLSRTNQVVALIGGGTLHATIQTGYLESIVHAALPYHQVRFHDLTRDGDTAFRQSREINFPDLTTQLKSIDPDVVVVQFGQMESLTGLEALPRFVEAYEKLLLNLRSGKAKWIVASPTPFFPSRAVNTADAALRHTLITAYTREVLELAARSKLETVDICTILTPFVIRSDVLSIPTLQLTVSFAIAQSLVNLSGPPPSVESESGLFLSRPMEELRQLVLQKNQLQFLYHRPTNWAFLAGDRTEQASSRDHRDRTIRWFPSEMEQFRPLINTAQERIARYARSHFSSSPGENP